MSLAAFESDHITITPWDRPAREVPGFDPRSPYVERYWLGIVGPSVCWLLRRIAAGFDASPQGFVLPLADTARALGLGDRGGRNSAFFRTLNRTVQFELARPTGVDALEVARRLPPLSRRQIGRLPIPLQEEHERWRTHPAAAPAPAPAPVPASPASAPAAASRTTGASHAAEATTATGAGRVVDLHTAAARH